MKTKICSIFLIVSLLLTSCSLSSKNQVIPSPVSPAAAAPQSSGETSATQAAGQSDQNGQSGQTDCRPDLTQAAAVLNITVDQLQSALGHPTQGKPDLTAAAAKLGVTADALQQAMRQALPSNCSAPGGGQPTSAANSGGQNAQGDPNAACRPDMTKAAVALNITADQLQSALGRPAQGKPDLTAAATKLGITADVLQQAMRQSIPSDCSTSNNGPSNGQTQPGGPSGQNDQGGGAQVQTTPTLVPASTNSSSVPSPSGMVSIPNGVFQMGDHIGFVDPQHPTDELPIHQVSISAFYIGKYDITVQQYSDYLNAALSQALITVSNGTVYLKDGKDILYKTSQAYQYSTISWDGSKFSVLNNRGNHPVTGVTWYGAAAYSNWLSLKDGYQPCYDTTSWVCDFNKNGYRLPTEAEWEYAARGGQYNPYFNYPWGNDADKTKANWPNSGDPYETGSQPGTTPVGFYDGQLHKKSDFGWPGSQDTYQTSNGANGFGLYDMAGNVWQWVNDWYVQNYYSSGPSTNPTGPTMAQASLKPDGKPYHGLRGGSWYNGEMVTYQNQSVDNGHSRVSNRDPAYYLGPNEFQDANDEIGFRIVRRDVQGSSTGNNQTQPTQVAQNQPTQAAASTVSNIAGRTVGLFLNSSQSFQGYTLLAPKQYGVTYLINNAGQVVHTWTSKYPPGQSAYLLPNGDLIRAATTRNPNINTGGGEGGRIEEYDWSGNMVWQLDYSTDKVMQHHDFVPLPNGNILMLVVEKKTYDEAIAAGFDPGKLQEVQKQGYILPDSVVEIKPTLPSGGTVVWEWHVWDHFVQNFSNSKTNFGNVAAHPELVDPNGGQHIPVFWNHMNSIAYNPNLDQVMVSVRGNSEIWAIDHSTTSAQAAGHNGGKSGKGGDLLYRWGNPDQYQAGTQKNEMLFQQHDGIWIDSNSPGAGDILIFNNGLGRGYSSIDEITPPVDANGNYTLAANSAYGPSKLTWTYQGTPPQSFYSAEISGATRLPNGNTLICSGVNGTLFEVTASGEMVWKYVNPVVRTGALGATDTIPEDTAKAGQYLNEVFKVQRYAPDFPGLVGRDLTPKGTIEK